MVSTMDVDNWNRWNCVHEEILINVGDWAAT